MKDYIPSPEIMLQYQQEIWDRREDVDPSDEQDWFSLTLGWAIAKGLQPEEAHYFSIYIRYKTDMG
jgi:hypothetical protein